MKNDQLSNKSLTQILLILHLLLGGQRMNTVYFFTIDRIAVTDIGVTFSRNHVAVSTVGYITTKSYVVDCLKEYLKRLNTKVQTDTKTLFITYGKPFRAAAIHSMRR